MKVSSLLRLAFAGQVDAGLSSVATFALQIFTVNIFEPHQLGAFSLAFAAFVTVSQVPAQIIYNPIEVGAVEHLVERRLTAVRLSLPPGLLVGLLVAPVVLAGGIPAFGQIDRASWWMLVGSAALVAVISPLQDHLRRMFHVADRSWSAVQMAVVQAVGVAVGILVTLPVNVVLVPFGALLIANLMSVTWGLVLAYVPVAGRATVEIDRRTRKHLGRWLFAAGLVTSGFGYLSSAIIGSLLGLAILGHIEAARVVARPVQVVSQGLLAIVGPRSMEAAAHGLTGEVLRWRRRYSVMLGSVTVPYLLLTAVDWDLNPMSRLVPVAYLVPGLVLAMLAAHWIQALNLPMESEMLGLKLARQLAWVAAVTALIQVVGSFTADLTLEFTAPLWIAVAAGAKRLMYRARIRAGLPELRDLRG